MMETKLSVIFQTEKYLARLNRYGNIIHTPVRICEIPTSTPSFIFNVFRYFEKGALKNIAITRADDIFLYMQVIWNDS